MLPLLPGRPLFPPLRLPHAGCRRPLIYHVLRTCLCRLHLDVIPIYTFTPHLHTVLLPCRTLITRTPHGAHLLRAIRCCVLFIPGSHVLILFTISFTHTHLRIYGYHTLIPAFRTRYRLFARVASFGPRSRLLRLYTDLQVTDTFTDTFASHTTAPVVRLDPTPAFVLSLRTVGAIWLRLPLVTVTVHTVCLPAHTSRLYAAFHVTLRLIYCVSFLFTHTTHYTTHLPPRHVTV